MERLYADVIIKNGVVLTVNARDEIAQAVAIRGDRILAVGSDADLVLFDPDIPWRIQAARQYQNVDYTPYEGMEMAGRTDTVLLSGQVAVAGGKVVAEGLGRYVHRGPAQFWR